jgi:hypothetical protein
MLDPNNPSMLYELGAFHDVLTPAAIHPAHYLTNLFSFTGRLDLQNDTQPINFFGWWLAGFPRTAIDEAGLPLQIFIRGDDREYGMRLLKLGYQPIPLLGCAIAHDPFYLKRSGVMAYYDFRNALIIDEEYRPKSIKLKLKYFLKYAFKMAAPLLIHDYEMAKARALALKDFRKGRQYLENGTPLTHHAAITAQLKNYSPKAEPFTLPNLKSLSDQEATLSRIGIESNERPTRKNLLVLMAQGAARLIRKTPQKKGNSKDIKTKPTFTPLNRFVWNNSEVKGDTEVVQPWGNATRYKFTRE